MPKTVTFISTLFGDLPRYRPRIKRRALKATWFPAVSVGDECQAPSHAVGLVFVVVVAVCAVSVLGRRALLDAVKDGAFEVDPILLIAAHGQFDLTRRV